MSILSSTKILAVAFATLAFSFPREANASTEPPIVAAVDPVPSPTVSPTIRPSRFEGTVEKANFRQEFLVDDARTFGDDVVATLELLYATYTVEYAPDFDAHRRISTDWTVERQDVLTVDPDAITDETDDHLLIVDFTVTFSSSYYDVTSYPQLFQDWTDSNLDVVLRDVQGLRADVNTLDKPKRIVISAMKDPTTTTTTDLTTTDPMTTTTDPTSVLANPPPSPAPTPSYPAPLVGQTAAPSRSPIAAEDVTSSAVRWMQDLSILALNVIIVLVVVGIFIILSRLRSLCMDPSKTSDLEIDHNTDDDSVDAMADDLERGRSPDAGEAETGGNRAADAALADFSFGHMVSVDLDW